MRTERTRTVITPGTAVEGLEHAYVARRLRLALTTQQNGRLGCGFHNRWRNHHPEHEGDQGSPDLGDPDAGPTHLCALLEGLASATHPAGSVSPNMSGWNAVDVDWQLARTALERQAHALSALVHGVDLEGRIPGMRWTSDDVLAHLVAQADSFAAFALGHRTPEDDLGDQDAALPIATRIAAVNDRLIADQCSRDLTGAVGRFLDSTARCDGAHPMRSWEGDLDVANATALLVSELAVHGFDIARSLQRPWQIEPTDAAVALSVGANLMPRFTSPRAVAGLEATFGIVAKPGPSVAVHVRDGALTVAPGRPERADCRIRADAVAMLLVAYRRRSLLWAVSRGALLAHGRRPWLGLRFTALIDQP